MERNKKVVAAAADDVYELVQQRPRGFAVIVNMAKGRPGSEKDVTMMTDLFEQLQYHVIKFEDWEKDVCTSISEPYYSIVPADIILVCADYIF